MSETLNIVWQDAKRKYGYVLQYFKFKEEIEGLNEKILKLFKTRSLLLKPDYRIFQLSVERCNEILIREFPNEIIDLDTETIETLNLIDNAKIKLQKSQNSDTLKKFNDELGFRYKELNERLSINYTIEYLAWLDFQINHNDEYINLISQIANNRGQLDQTNTETTETQQKKKELLQKMEIGKKTFESTLVVSISLILILISQYNPQPKSQINLQPNQPTNIIK